MLARILFVLLLAPTAYSLICNSCDSFLSCNTPFPETCPPRAHCYTLKKHGTGEIIMKGCVHSCANLPYTENAHCETCHHADFCNSGGVPIGNGAGFDTSHHSIGGGAAPYYDIGHGVYPRNGAPTFAASIATILIAKFLVF
ncbi:unnamed protein product [Caenorhabditis bovis]|uniref:UPAR/Ly6 domain-containing protein n=1 Tax=Caenorhabditis bovis TaxID=2654633 RepID=A0A8S1EWK1_9PELO|nr:unnamed protein product [Caenorhabditis bovis]